MVGVQLIDRRDNLPHNNSNAGFSQRCTLLDLFVELPAKGHFQNNVNVHAVIKIAIHLDDVRVIQKQLYFQLTDKLLCNLFILEHLLLNDFESTNKFGLFLLHQENLAVLASPQLVDSLEIIKCKLALCFLFLEWLGPSVTQIKTTFTHFGPLYRVHPLV